MADIMGIEIRYKDTYSRESLEVVFRALNGAIAENWNDRDEWSSSGPEPPVDVDAWLTRCDPGLLVWDDIFRQWRPLAKDAPALRYTELFCAFSPRSAKLLSVAPIKDCEGFLVLRCLVYASVLYELLGDRQAERMEEEWDRIRAGRGEADPRERGPSEDAPDYDDWWEKRSRLDDTFSAWPLVKGHLRRIIDALQTALPVRDERIDPRLQGVNPAPVTDQRLLGRRDLFRG